MGSEYFEVAQATAVVGYDALTLYPKLGRRPFSRRIARLGLGGSAVAADYDMEAFVEGVSLGTFKNLAGGASIPPKVEGEFQRVNIPVPAHFLLELKFTTQPTTNAALGIIESVP